MNSSEVILDIGTDFSFFFGNFFLKCVKYFFNKIIFDELGGMKNGTSKGKFS